MDDSNSAEVNNSSRNNNKVRLAVFDFDGTSIEGSSPTRLVRHLMADGKLSPLTSLKIGLWGLAYKWKLPQNEAWVRGLVFKPFADQPKQLVDDYIRTFYDEHIDQRFRPDADAAMRERAAEGCEVVVVSASFEPMVQRAMETRPFSHQISTRMQVNAAGNYTQKVEGRPMEGAEKLRALTRWADANYGKGNWELTYAYGDHHSDAPLLQAAKHPFAVSPNSELKRIAKAKLWPILNWEFDPPHDSEDDL